MLATLIASLLLAPQGGASLCAVSGEALPPNAPTVDALGARFRFCCAECAGKFKADPTPHLDAAAKAGRLAGTFLYDPVSGRRLTASTARGGFARQGAIRYGFENPRNRATFEANPERFTGKLHEVLYCPVKRVELVNYYGTNGYVEVDGMRVYMCCDGCLATMRAKPESYAELARAHLAPPKAFDVPDALSRATWPPQ